MFVRLFRMLPVNIFLGVVALVIYLVVSARQSPVRAKEVLIKVFLVITGVLSGLCLLGSLYALADGHSAAFELIFAFFIASLVCLGITLVCRYIFLKHHPSYRKKPLRTRKIYPWEKTVRLWIDRIKQALQLYQNIQRNQKNRNGK